MSMYHASTMVLLKSIENTDVKSVEKSFYMKPVVFTEWRGDGMTLIILTRKHDGKKVYINPTQICFMGSMDSEGDGTIIQFPGDDGNYIQVLESPEAISGLCKLVTEWPYKKSKNTTETRPNSFAKLFAKAAYLTTGTARLCVMSWNGSCGILEKQ